MSLSTSDVECGQLRISFNINGNIILYCEDV